MEEETQHSVKIDVPQHYKSRVTDEVWEELENFLYLGFLTTTVTFGEATFVFKTLNHLEIRNINFMKPGRTSAPGVRAAFRSAFIAHSVFMFNGTNVLYERPRNIHKLVRTMAKFSDAIQDKILENLTYLNERVMRLLPLVEAYVYENRSRFRWMQLGSMPIHDPRFTGTPGTDELGMNVCQLNWTALNQILDKREIIEREWSNAKFIGGCFAGRGIRSIEEKDRSRLEKERVDREEKKIKVLQAYLNRTAPGQEPEQTVQLPDGRRAVVVKKFQANSAEELAEQLSAALSGEKDFHDLVIEQKQREHEERAKQLEKDKFRFFKSVPANQMGTQIGTSASRVMSGKGEVDAYISRMQELRQLQMERFRQPEESSESSSEDPK